ncbi:MAG: response regulator [Gemmatimonadota bacterium]
MSWGRISSAWLALAVADDALAARLLAIFIDELDEQVQQLNVDMLALERNPADAERLRGVFRVMHTLKGASRAAGLPAVEELCHVVETELSGIRGGVGAIDGTQIALLFKVADALEETRNDLRAGLPTPDATLAAVLHMARGRGLSAPLVRAPAKPTTPSPQPAVMAAPTAPTVEESARATGQIRVSLHQVDAIAGAAGEIAGLATTLSDRAADVAALRSRRRHLRGGAPDGGLDRELTQLLRCANEDARALAALSGRLGASARHLRQRPLGEITETLPRAARDVATVVEKQVRVTLVGGEIEADRAVLEALREPLLHIVRNAIDHGIERPEERVTAGKPAEGEVRIEGSLRGDRLRLAVSDDGHGLDLDAVRRGIQRRGRSASIDQDALALAIFDDGFSTRDTATTISGRGVGLAIVRAAAERMGGTASVTSHAGVGTTITLDVPVSVATMRVVLVDVGGVLLGIPSTFVVRAARADPRKLARADGRAMLVTKQAPIAVVSLAALLGAPFAEPAPAAMIQLVILENSGRTLAIVVDDLIDERELVLRPLEHAGPAATESIVGTALLSTGAVTLVLNVPALVAEGQGRSSAIAGMADEEGVRTRAPSRVLVVDDSITSRTLEQSVLSAAGYEVITAVDGAEAWRMLERQTVALVVSDVEMPHLDGFGLCERIRANPRTASLPVILVTSLDEPAQRARGLEAGADAYITKSSFDQDTLLDTVRMLIGRAAGQSR